MDRVLLDRLAAHRGVAVPDPERLPAVADDLGWRLADLLAVSGSAIPAELMPADPAAKPQIRSLLDWACRRTADEIDPIRRYARSLPAVPDPRGQPLQPVTPMRFGTGLWRLMLVRNLNVEAVCRTAGWAMTLLSRLVQDAFPPEPVWLLHLGDVLDLRPDDLAAIAGVPAPCGDEPTPDFRSRTGGLVLDLIPLSAKTIGRVARHAAEREHRSPRDSGG